MFRVLFLVFTFCATSGYSQKVYNSIAEANKSPLEVRSLNLSKKKLKSIPADILQYPNLRQLDLSKNKLSEINIDLSLLEHLLILDLGNNQLSTIPNEVTGITTLEELHLSRNPITTIPNDFSKLVNLIVFDCWHCNLTELPEAMKANEKLIEIDIRQTYIRQQDASIYNEWWPNTKILTTWGCNCGK